MNLFDQITWKSSVQGFLGQQPTATQAPQLGSFQQAPRTESYVQPKAKAQPVKMSPTAVDSPFFKWVQWAANMFTWAKEWLLGVEWDDKAIFEQEMNAKKQKFAQDKLKEGYTQQQIDWALNILQEKGEFDYKPWFWARLATNLGKRMQETETTTENLSKESNIAKRVWAWALAYAWDITGGVASDVIWAAIEPVVSPVVKKLVEATGQQENIAEFAKWWEDFKASNPLLADSIEWALNITSVGLPVTKAGQAVVKAPARIAKDIVVWATELPWKTVNKVKSFFPTPEAKLVKSLGQETTPWVVAWKNVQVPVPEKWIIEKVTFWLGREKDPKVLAGRALTPTYAGKTPKQILATVWDVEKNVKELYDKVRTWVYKGDISTLESAANTVVTNLDEVGSKIGASVKDATWKIPLSKNRMEIKKVLSDPIEKRWWAWKILKNFYDDTAPIDWLSIQRAFKTKKIYQAEIKKLIKSWDTWTDAYEALVKWVQELNDSIDNAVANTPWFKEWKAQYSHLKKLVSDISKSAAVEWRRSPQTFVEQLGMVENLMEAASNPLSTAWKLFAKEIGELNTRGWAWKELMKIYDTDAIEQATNGTMKNSVKPRKVKVTK